MKYTWVVQKVFLILCGSTFLALHVCSQCHQVTLTSSNSHQNLLGDYQFYCQQDDGKPIYKHKMQGAYIYNIQNSSNYWTVGPVVGGVYAYLKAKDGAGSPDKVKNKWKAWSSKERKWIDDGAKFYCSDCKTMLLNGSGIPEGIKGRYHSQHIIHNLRPIFKHQSNALYLHYTRCNKWVVGPKVGENLGAMFTVSNASTPWGITETWTVYLSTSQVDTEEVDATCLDQMPNVFKPKSWKGCGLNQLDDDGPVNYLLGGTEVTRGKFPWMVSVKRPDGIHRCGAVLIGSRWLLTAGHCTDGTGPSHDTALLGVHNLDLAKEEERQSYKIKSAYRHPNYTWIHDPYEVDKDLAVLELEEDVVYDSHVQPVCFPDSPAMQFINSAEECFLIGWGKTDFQGRVGDVLRELKGRVIDARTCGNTILSMLQHWFPDSSSLCVLPKNYGKICIGDSGGPLLCSRNRRWYTVGVASWVIVECLQTNLPSVYMDVTQDLAWIKSICQCV